MSDTGSYRPRSPEEVAEVNEEGGDATRAGGDKRILRRTEKGREYQCNVEKAEYERLRRRLSRQGKLLQMLLQTRTNKDKVNHECNEFDKTFTDLVAAYGRVSELLESEEERTLVVKAMDEMDAEVFQFKSEIYAWLSTVEAADLPKVEDDVCSQKSSRHSKVPMDEAARSHVGSQRSVSSRSGSLRSGRSKRSSEASSRSRKSLLDQKAEIAGLRAEATLLKETREAELHVELLRYEQRIRKVEAIERVYAEEEEKDELYPKSVCAAEYRLPKKDRKQPVVQKFSGSLLEVLQAQSAPKVVLDVFSGDVLEFQYFVATFREVVERVVTDERGRLTRLIQYTTGEAKELVRHCIHDDADTCYTQAMALLEKHYGDPHRIACAYVKELRQWPAIKANDSSAFRSFNRFLIKCSIYKKKGKFLRELDSVDIISTLVMKLPLNLQDKWNRKVDSLRRKSKRVANFSDFADLIDTESSLANDPLYSREALYGNKDKTLDSSRVKSFATQPEEEAKVQACLKCGDGHDLDDCPVYKELPREERIRFLFAKRLCFGCYGAVSSTHTAKSCTQRRNCKLCNKEHPTGLHKGDNVTSRSTVSQLHGANEGFSVCVVPVCLSHRDCPEKENSIQFSIQLNFFCSNNPHTVYKA